MSKTNAQAVAAFIRQEPADALHLHSDGRVLRSYGTPIAVWQDDNTIRVSCQHHSITTTSHHTALQQAATAAGFTGPASWEGDPHRKRRKRDELAETVLFHDFQWKDGRVIALDPPVTGKSDRDALAVVWTFSQASYDDHANHRAWMEERGNVTLSRKEPIPS